MINLGFEVLEKLLMEEIFRWSDYIADLDLLKPLSSITDPSKPCYRIGLNKQDSKSNQDRLIKQLLCSSHLDEILLLNAVVLLCMSIKA